MPTPIKLYHIPPSPNSMKARIALAFKKLPYEKIPVNPTDRSDVVRLSRQPLTPIMLHGETVVYDSEAILRYLDANFKDTPSLLSENYEEMRSIEQWETFARYELRQPVDIVFREFFATKRDPDAPAQASRMLDEMTGCIEDQLIQSPWLVSDRMTIADVTAAPYVYYGMLPREAVESSPVAKFFAQSLRLGKNREKTRGWVERVMAYDR